MDMDGTQISMCSEPCLSFNRVLVLGRIWTNPAMATTFSFSVNQVLYASEITDSHPVIQDLCLSRFHCAQMCDGYCSTGTI